MGKLNQVWADYVGLNEAISSTIVYVNLALTMGHIQPAQPILCSFSYNLSA